MMMLPNEESCRQIESRSHILLYCVIVCSLHRLCICTATAVVIAVHPVLSQLIVERGGTVSDLAARSRIIAAFLVLLPKPFDHFSSGTATSVPTYYSSSITCIYGYIQKKHRFGPAVVLRSKLDE